MANHSTGGGFSNSNALFLIGFLRRGGGQVVLAGRFSNGDLMAFLAFRTIALASLTAILSAGSLAAGQVVYPAKGQSAEQQKSDEAACYTWAVEQSGYDPAAPPPLPAASAEPTQPSGPTGARARGALAGAVVGEIADGDVGEAALAGAVVGGSRERRQRRQADQQAQAQAQQQEAEALNARKQGEEAFSRARAACLEGRGYAVK